MKTRTLFSTFSLAAMMTLGFSLVSCGTEIDKEGIFKEIEGEIELKDAVAKGNIFDIVPYGGKLYAGGGKVYVKDYPESPGGWRVFSGSPLSGGLVVRMAINGGIMTVQCRKGGTDGENSYWQMDFSQGFWLPSSPSAFPLPAAAGGFPGQSVTCSCTGPLGTYYGTTTGAFYSPGGGVWAKLPGSNVDATIGSYYISAIYASPGGAIYVGTIGSGTTNGTKKNGLWAYYPPPIGEWNRE